MKTYLSAILLYKISKRALCFAFFIVMAFAVPVFAKSSTLEGFYFMQKINNSTSNEPQHSQHVDGRFLLSEALFSGTYDGKLTFIGGKTTLDCKFSGDIYLYETDVEITDNFEITNGEVHYILGNNPPYYITYILFGLLQSILGAIFLVVLTKQLSQASSVFIKQTAKSVQYGALIFFMIAAAIFIFAFSVVGLPIALLFFAALMIFTIAGQVPLAVCLGRLALRFSGIKSTAYLSYSNIFICYAVGTILLDVFRIVPYLYILSNFVLIPIGSLGPIAVALVNRYFLKVHHKSFFTDTKKEKKDFRSIIVRGLE